MVSHPKVKLYIYDALKGPKMAGKGIPGESRAPDSGLYAGVVYATINNLQITTTKRSC